MERFKDGGQSGRLQMLVGSRGKHQLEVVDGGRRAARWKVAQDASSFKVWRGLRDVPQADGVEKVRQCVGVRATFFGTLKSGG